MTGARRGLDCRVKIIWQVETCSDEKLAAAFLWQAEFHTILDLGVNTVANGSRLLLHPGKIFAAGCRADAEHILHHENFGLEEFHIAQEFLIEMSRAVFDEAFTVICSVHLPDSAEPLARWSAHDYINNAVRAYQLCEFLPREIGLNPCQGFEGHERGFS